MKKHPFGFEGAVSANLDFFVDSILLVIERLISAPLIKRMLIQNIVPVVSPLKNLLKSLGLHCIMMLKKIQQGK